MRGKKVSEGHCINDISFTVRRKHAHVQAISRGTQIIAPRQKNKALRGSITSEKREKTQRRGGSRPWDEWSYTLRESTYKHE